MGFYINRFLCLIAAIMVCAVILLEFQRPSPTVAMAPAHEPDYRSSKAVPAAWTQFAQLVQDQFKALLEANDGTADRFRLFLKNRAVNGDGSSNALLVHVWVGADGKIERVQFPTLSDRQADTDLHMLLERGNIGAPPADMPQPLHVKLALDSKS
jgi:hypothetical protein